MNYRHSFHAGNFADVVKHATLASIIAYLLQKPSAFRYIDTHAGVGAYDLHSDTAQRTGEWENGIGRIFNHAFSPANAAFLAPYFNLLKAMNPDGGLNYYPGSPEIAARLLRPDDRMVLCELHEEDHKHLRWRYSYNKRVKTCCLDGFTGLNAFVPPKERRGVVLIDPPFEKTNEYERIFSTLAAAHKKWATGIYMLWYPIKHASDTDAFIRKMHNENIGRMLQAELYIRAPNTTHSLNGTGLLLINPPWVLGEALENLFKELAPLLQAGEGYGWKIAALEPEALNL